MDAGRFERMAADGRRALLGGEPAIAAGLLTAALAQWRGEPYAEFEQVVALHCERTRLERLRLAAVEDRLDADLACGRGAGLVIELEELTRRHPGNERLRSRLMVALYRAGQVSDALSTYLRARAVLIEDFGLEPSTALAETHRRVLTQDPRLLVG